MAFGWAMVVNAGWKKLASGRSSKPTTDTSWGHDSPAWLTALIAPNAISSLKQKTAVTLRPSSRAVCSKAHRAE